MAAGGATSKSSAIDSGVNMRFQSSHFEILLAVLIGIAIGVDGVLTWQAWK